VDLPAVVVAGSTPEARSAVVGELLGMGNRVLDVPDESYLVLRHGESRAAWAFLPGARQPYPYSASFPGADPVPGSGHGEPPPRPPRRVELSLPAPLLTSCTLVEAPVGGAFGLAYNRIVLRTARRGGALLFTLDAQVPPGQAELDFLAAAERVTRTVIFALWTGGAEAPPLPAFRDAIVSRVPGFAEAPWFPVAPGAAGRLRQALLDWSGAAGPDGGVAGTGVAGTGPRRRVPTAVDGREAGWEEVLDRAVAAAQREVREALTIELANLHQRCVQDIDFGGGCAGMPAALDRELHALALYAADRVGAAVAEVTRRVLAHVLAGEAHDDVLHRVAAALRDRIEEDRPGLARVLLVTSTSGAVAAVPGAVAADALPACQTATWPGVLPPLGVGLSASCYQKWCDEKADVEAARRWLRDAVHGTELQLQQALAERFEVVRQVLRGLVGDAVDHGLLLV